ncbi:DUF1573 domain-containing protein [Elizabethkingia sp. JS20170427COW]|uniref:DUF1573 domain-containing protein n=1 Tax=Elizabethkingia sp. JS20170427COW TaxID=2583851 RepID=UPI0011102B48|nr:DUF1573 domain-containing protein [Elizabethkingia sp. JS20170427COW]QCX53404.1 DUF1573 domain-containing protein [Elizabethkingia sp. JS20170427COW]
MKKIQVLLASVALGFVLVSCNKTNDSGAQGAQSAVEATSSQEFTALSEDQPREDAIKEAQNHPLTQLVISQPFYNFGDVKKGEQVEHTYEITNTGDKPLIISSVKPGCGCTAPEYTKDPILPGQKGQVKLKFDSSSFEGLQQKSAEVFTNTEKSPVVLNFTANVINPS